VGDVSVEARHGHAVIVIGIRYDDKGEALIDGIQRISRPGRRNYVGKADVPRVRHGLGVAVLSTSKGILSDDEAREQSVGGELLCEVW
jgi:small subunit ribosomal protein S8